MGSLRRCMVARLPVGVGMIPLHLHIMARVVPQKIQTEGIFDHMGEWSPHQHVAFRIRVRLRIGGVSGGRHDCNGRPLPERSSIAPADDCLGVHMPLLAAPVAPLGNNILLAFGA